jgi:pyruvate kinase
MNRPLSACRTKTMATLGPATSDAVVIRAMVEAGMDAVRLNFSHGDHAEHAARIKTVRRVEAEVGRPIAILQDLPGPKIRIGDVGKDPLSLRIGETVAIAFDGKLRPPYKTLPVRFPRLAGALKKGHAVYLVDGLVRLEVLSLDGSRALCRVRAGGDVRSGSGINLPDADDSFPAFTPADAQHLAFGLSQGVDIVALSFVGSAVDVRRARAFCRARGRSPLLIAKIERRLAVQNVESIADEADGLMVARGDLGIEIPFADVPRVQRDIVGTARRKGKLSCVATHLLESMIQNPRPTRAEVTDVANGVLEGVDILLLTAETSIGKHPVEAMAALDAVIGGTERRPVQPLRWECPNDARHVLAEQAALLAERLNAACIVVPSITGGTAARLSRFLPSVPILALTERNDLRRRFGVYRGVEPFPFPSPNLGTDAGRRAILRALKVPKGRTVVLVGRAAPRPSAPLFLEVLTAS